MQPSHASSAAMPSPSRLPFPPLPPLGRLALLLDLDGTLIDLAERPDAVRVPPGLTAMLGRLSGRLGGALAVVSGRVVEQVASLLAGLDLAIAGEHGAALRWAGAGTIERPNLPLVPTRWRQMAARIAAQHAGVLFEEKPHGFVLHYRGAPEAGPALASALAEVLDGEAADFLLSPSAMAWEVRPRGVSKADAVRALLAEPPFAGRVPVFVGDDTTDEDGIRAAREAGGYGFRVAETFCDAAGVRAWLAWLADAPGAAEAGAAGE